MDRHAKGLHARRRGAAKHLWLALLLATSLAWAQTRLEVVLETPVLQIGIETLADEFERRDFGLHVERSSNVVPASQADSI